VCIIRSLIAGLNEVEDDNDSNSDRKVPAYSVQ
jgi:hypothetical protein